MVLDYSYTLFRKAGSVIVKVGVVYQNICTGAQIYGALKAEFVVMCNIVYTTVADIHVYMVLLLERASYLVYLCVLVCPPDCAYVKVTCTRWVGAGEDVGTDICTSSGASYLSGSTARQSGLCALLCSSAVITGWMGKLWLAG